MTLLTWSIIGNAVFAVALLIVVIRAKRRLVDEKLATFSGCLNALSFGLAPADADKRCDRLAFGLKSMFTDASEDEILWRLIRASLMRYFRAEPVAADLGEHLHAFTLECMRGEAKAEAVWAYIDGALAQQSGFETEPAQRFTAAELARGQMQLEADLFRVYAATLQKSPPVLFER